MSLLDDSRNSQREASRGRSDTQRGPRTAQEAKPKDVYYRPEYGWVMSNEMVKQEKAVKGQYDARVSAAEERVRQNDTKFQDAIASGNSQIAGSYGPLLNGSNQDLVPVRVVGSGDKIEGTYMLPRSTVDSLKVGGSYQDGGINYNVPASQQMHDALRNAETDYNAAYEANRQNIGAEYGATSAGFKESADKQYEGAKAVWASELENLRGAYGRRVATGKATYEDSKAKYNESVMGVDEGLLETPTKMVNPEVKPNAEVNNGN